MRENLLGHLQPLSKVFLNFKLFWGSHLNSLQSALIKKGWGFSLPTLIQFLFHLQTTFPVPSCLILTPSSLIKRRKAQIFLLSETLSRSNLYLSFSQCQSQASLPSPSMNSPELYLDKKSLPEMLFLKDHSHLVFFLNISTNFLYLLT